MTNLEDVYYTKELKILIIDIKKRYITYLKPYNAQKHER